MSWNYLMEGGSLSCASHGIHVSDRDDSVTLTRLVREAHCSALTSVHLGQALLLQISYSSLFPRQGLPPLAGLHPWKKFIINSFIIESWETKLSTLDCCSGECGTGRPLRTYESSCPNRSSCSSGRGLDSSRWVPQSSVACQWPRSSL